MEGREKPALAIIVPCHDEEAVLSEAAKRLGEKIGRLIEAGIVSEKSSILFIDDGSRDSSWSLIEKLHREKPQLYSGIKLSRNCGQQNALLCGLLAVKDSADAAVTIDADLQDDVDAIDKMLECYASGTDIVYGVRSGRKGDSFRKRISARFFYRFMRTLGANLIPDHADFRLLSRMAINALAEYGEANLFLRGIIPLLGFPAATVYYERKERVSGKSKYTAGKMFDFALDGICSFSVRPLRFILLLGVLVLGTSLVLAIIYSVRIFCGLAINPFAPLLCSLWAIGGVIVLSIGIVGEYVGKILAEAKRRPRWHVEKTLYAPEEPHEKQ